jgi:hypothetical protein
MATEGTGAERARDLGQGWKVSPSVAHRAGRDLRAGRHRGARRDPADLDDADRQLALQHPAHLLGRPGAALGRVPGRRLLRLRLGRVRAGLVAGGVRQPGSAFNCYWEMPFRKRCRITMTNIADEPMTLYYQINYTLTDVPEDAPTSTPSSAASTRCPTRRSTRSSTACRGRALRRHLHGLGRQQQRLVGRGRDQVLPGRRRRVPHHLRHRHRGLLLRLVQLREPGRRHQYQEFTTPYAGLPR